MVASIATRKVAKEDLRLEALEPATERAFLYCAELPFLARSSWYLAGGTALALQAGHRSSVDLDFFTPRARFAERAFEALLLGTGKWTTSLRQSGTIYGSLMDVRMSFISYPFFQPSSERISFGNITMLSPHDIAAMKIVAVSQRGRKRDFVDLYWYCVNREKLVNVIERAVRQYPGQEQNVNHFLRSLAYFEDAERDPMPKIFFNATWKDIKKYFEREVPKIAKEILLS
jgi:hypothetical protein